MLDYTVLNDLKKLPKHFCAGFEGALLPPHAEHDSHTGTVNWRALALGCVRR